MMSYVKPILNEGSPVVIGGNNGKTDHYVLVVGYINNGSKQSDYIVVNPCYATECPCTMEDFYNIYKYTADCFGNVYNVLEFFDCLEILNNLKNF